MTEEQKKAIDACKDQAAQEFEWPKGNKPFKSWADFKSDVHSQHLQDELSNRAMQLYGEQCRKERAEDIVRVLQLSKTLIVQVYGDADDEGEDDVSVTLNSINWLIEQLTAQA